MSVAVIGAGGFLGGHLATALAKLGTTVFGYTREAPFLRPDGTADEGLASATTAFYLASSINPAIAETDAAAVEGDLSLFRSFLGAVRDLSIRVVFPSSGGTVYDTTLEPPYDEDARIRPRTRFGEIRESMEHELLETVGAFEPVVLRISNAYGPGQRAGTGQGVIAHWFASAANGEPLRLYGSPETTRDFIYIDDVVDAMVRTAERPDVPTIINIGSGQPTTLGHLAEIVSQTIGDVDIERLPDRGFDVARTWLDIRRAEDALRWSPLVDLADGLARTWAAWERR